MRIALTGRFTFTNSAAKNLITAAGGILVGKYDPNIDYLVYGFIENLDSGDCIDELIKKAILSGEKGENPKLINELALLKLCGVTFFDEVIADEQS